MDNHQDVRPFSTRKYRLRKQAQVRQLDSLDTTFQKPQHFVMEENVVASREKTAFSQVDLPPPFFRGHFSINGAKKELSQSNVNMKKYIMPKEVPQCKDEEEEQYPEEFRIYAEVQVRSSSRSEDVY